MLTEMKALVGLAPTVSGPVPPAALGRVMMHEHLHADIYDWDRSAMIVAEAPISAERRELLMTEAVPHLKACREHGCGAFVDPTMPPWRAWPTFYREVTEATGLHIVLATGFYRELEDGAYWVNRPEDRIWPFVTHSPVEVLAEMCVREIAYGIHGTDVRAGVIKLGSSQPEMTPTEEKAFRAGTRAWRETGVHITTHCTQIGAESSQLRLLEAEGVDLSRVVIGHTAAHLSDPDCRRTCVEWMRRGANFLPTNLGIGPDGGECWRPLVEAMKEIFDLGLGEHLALGLDWAFLSESGPFGACTFVPPPPYLHLFTHALPAFRRFGLTPEMEDFLLVRNPQRIIPVRAT